MPRRRTHLSARRPRAVDAISAKVRALSHCPASSAAGCRPSSAYQAASSSCLCSPLSCACKRAHALDLPLHSD